MMSNNTPPADIESNTSGISEATLWNTRLSHVSTATTRLVDPLFQENAREDLLESLKACQNDDARYELLLQTIQNPALYDALLDAYEEFWGIGLEDIIGMMIVHYQESDSKGLKAFMRRLFARYKNTSMFSYVVRFLEHAPENTFDALHAIEFLEPGYVDMVIRNHHVFSDNALDHLMYWVGKEYPEYISQANQLFQEIPLDRMGHFLARIPYYDPERQRSIFQVLLNRGVDQEFLDKVRPYFSDLSDGEISSLMRQNQK